MPIDPLIIGGLIGGVGSALGGLFGLGGQKSANRQNLQIARETNEANLQIARETNQQQLEMFERQLAYNSPLNQRDMMEQAGFNPYSLYANGLGAAASAPSAPALHAASQYAPTMVPTDALGRSLSNVTQDIASLVSARASAQKDLAEAKNLDVDFALKKADLLFAIPKRVLELKQLGINVDTSSIIRDVQKGTLDDQIRSAQLNNDYIDSLIGVNKERIVSAQMDNFIKKWFGVSEKAASIKHTLEEIRLLHEKGETEKSQQLLNDKVGDATVRDSFTRQFLGSAQAENERAQAHLTRVNTKLVPRRFALEYQRDLSQIVSAKMSSREMHNRANYWYQQARYWKVKGDLERYRTFTEMGDNISRMINNGKQAFSSSSDPGYQIPDQFNFTNSTW